MGIQQLTYDFRTDDVEEQLRMIEQLADRVLPAVA
jgi:hypothetical protein